MSKLDSFTDHDIDSLHKKLAQSIWLAELYNQMAICAISSAGMDVERVKSIAKANMDVDEQTHTYTTKARECGAPETEALDG